MPLVIKYSVLLKRFERTESLIMRTWIATGKLKYCGKTIKSLHAQIRSELTDQLLMNKIVKVNQLRLSIGELCMMRFEGFYDNKTKEYDEELTRILFEFNIDSIQRTLKNNKILNQQTKNVIDNYDLVISLIVLRIMEFYNSNHIKFAIDKDQRSAIQCRLETLRSSPLYIELQTYYEYITQCDENNEKIKVNQSLIGITSITAYSFKASQANVSYSDDAYADEESGNDDYFDHSASDKTKRYKKNPKKIKRERQIRQENKTKKTSKGSDSDRSVKSILAVCVSQNKTKPLE